MKMELLGEHDGMDMENTQHQGDYLEEVELEIKDIALPFFKHLAPFRQQQNQNPSPLRAASASTTGATPTATPNSADSPTRPISPHVPIKSVSQYLWPEIVPLTLVTLDGQVRLVEYTKPLPGRPRELNPQEQLKAGPVIGESCPLPRFQASSVFIGRDAGFSAFPASVRNTTGEFNYICNIISKWDRKSILDEIMTLFKLNKANLSSETRSPSIKGLIYHDNSIVGFLINKILAKYCSLETVLQNRPDVVKDNVSKAQKTKWIGQIEHTVSELHRIGLVWGDAKPENVIIGTDDNAWLIDFGGGLTPPWVEPGMRRTKEGDIQAVNKMTELLFDPEVVGTAEGYEKAWERMMEDYRARTGDGRLPCPDW